MIRYIVYLTIALSILLTSCKSEPSLQKYFVQNSENKNFVTLDIAPSILNLDKSKLSLSQTEALKSFDKINVLAFKITDKNKAQFETERTKITAILKDEKYQQLMKFGSGAAGASVSFVGTDDKIEEFVLFGNQKTTGFAVVRVLGKDMNPTNIIEMISALKESKLDIEQLKPLAALFVKDSIKQ
jgi:Domain of unknown function (DUF4252)